MTAERALTPWIFAILGFLLGAGLVFGWRPEVGLANPSAGSADRGGAGAVAEKVIALDGVERAAASVDEPDRELVPADSAERRVAALFSPQLLAYARAGLCSGWRERRSDVMPDAELERGLARFTDQVRRLPRSLGMLMADAATKPEKAVAIGPAFALIQRIENGFEGPVLPLLRDARHFAELFDRTYSQLAIDGTAYLTDLKEVVEDGATLSFGPGVFRVQGLMRGRLPFPREVTLRGMGMDATMLFLDEIDVRQALQNFAIEDCTIFTDDYLTDLRSVPATIRMRRVRVIGFDIGAGSSLVFALKGTVLDCQDCRCEGGYGRSPTSGNLLRSSSAGFIARFDRCSFSRIHFFSSGLRSRATVLFTNCSMQDVFDDPRAAAARHDGVELDGCRVVVALREDLPKLKKRLDLNLLFPQWQEQMVR